MGTEQQRRARGAGWLGPTYLEGDDLIGLGGEEEILVPLVEGFDSLREEGIHSVNGQNFPLLLGIFQRGREGGREKQHIPARKTT